MMYFRKIKETQEAVVQLEDLHHLIGSLGTSPMVSHLNNIFNFSDAFKGAYKQLTGNIHLF